jgi:hypothetical protein
VRLQYAQLVTAIATVALLWTLRNLIKLRFRTRHLSGHFTIPRLAQGDHCASTTKVASLKREREVFSQSSKSGCGKSDSYMLDKLSKRGSPTGTTRTTLDLSQGRKHTERVPGWRTTCSLPSTNLQSNTAQARSKLPLPAKQKNIRWPCMASLSSILNTSHSNCDILKKVDFHFRRK